MESIAAAQKASEKEKKLVALSSVLAAVFITTFKFIIGMLTHSLGIMAEAAHSALDLVAAAVTFFAVRISDKAPDEKLMFGYGKVENLSALFETFLLLVTCAWIIYEAVQRLFYKSVQVEVSIWSFVVMLTSIIVDVSRSRALMKAAKKHGSQALEADALHFSTDVWSSSVVIGGLVLVTAGEYLRDHTSVSESLLVWFHRADAIAALGVSIIVIFVSVQLGRRTIEGLLDRAPSGLGQDISQKVSRIPGLLKVRQVRIRPSGPSTFVDMIIEIPRGTTFEQAHNIGMQAKAIVKGIIPRVDVMVHMDPMVADRSSVMEAVQSAAARAGLGVHSIRINQNGSQLDIDMHIEVPEEFTIQEAHTRADDVEKTLREEILNLGEVSSHIEPRGDHESRHMVNTVDAERIRLAIAALPGLFPEVKDCHHIHIYQEGDNLSASLHCLLDPAITVTEAHQITARMERSLRQQAPDLDRVYIHAEPLGE